MNANALHPEEQDEKSQRLDLSVHGTSVRRSSGNEEHDESEPSRQGFLC